MHPTISERKLSNKRAFIYAKISGLTAFIKLQLLAFGQSQQGVNK